MAAQPYDRDSPVSYALGVYPSLALLELNPRCARRLLLDERGGGEGIERLVKLCAGLGVRAEAAPRLLRRVSGKENCFAAVEFDKGEACGEILPGKPHIALVQPSDQGNIGAILRSMVGFGFGDLAIIDKSADIFDPHTVRASMGALFALRVSVFGGGGFDRYRAMYPEHAVYPFMLGASLTLGEAARSHAEPYTLVFGNEGAGLPERYMDVGKPVVIPQRGVIDSLNLSVAVSVAMYAFSSSQTG
ncbi:MAG: TrmH family RNA methyltransferase [Oscillospiraceae bacterium]|jgi:TrmH family RNA methyltransferase|nr:TrmH family RNA methyltransferase [Oscillospiraceae bacterium]